MALIDFDKFLASFITEIKKNHMVITYNIPSCIKKALEDQGLEYKGGEIVKNQRRISAEAKENGYGESEDEEIVKLADEYYNKVLLKECDMEEKEAHHCRLSYIHGAKAMLEKQGQNPAWSEEDKRILYNVKAFMGYAAGQRGVREDEYKEANDWLKSLKDRVQPQPKHEWSEEDERAFHHVLSVLEEYGEEHLSKSKFVCNWLKSIKTRMGGDKV